MAKLYFRYGAMGSSKTANAIMVHYNYRERGQNALMLKPKLDSRDGDRIVASRSGLRTPCRYVEELDQVDLSRLDCIIVDEAQFLKKEQVQKLVDIVDQKNIPVICYGLRADFRGELFEGSLWLMALADTIEEIKTVCWCGRKATCNARILNGKVVKTGEQIQLGGNESYVSLCRKHWSSGELAPIEIRKIDIEKKRFLPLLLEADPSEQMIDRYLEQSDVYVMNAAGKDVCIAVARIRDDGVCELYNIATLASERGKGYAGKMLRHLFDLYSPLCKTMEAGTDKDTVAFYERFGFKVTYQRKNYFKDNYNPPIVENGKTLVDMYVLEVSLHT